MRATGVVVCLLSGAVAAIVACGDDGGAHKLPDAPETDGATPDTPDPPLPARLTITRDGSGVESVDVYFQNADNSLVAKVPTDANGVAEATVMPGAYVTVVNPFLVQLGVRQDDVETIAGVQPGDHLRLTYEFGRQTLTNVNVVVDPDPNGSQHTLWATCMEFNAKSNASMPFGLAIGSGETRPAGQPDMINCTKTDMLVESDNGSGDSVGWIFKDDVAITANADIDIAGPYTASPDVTVNYTDVPASVTGFSIANFLGTSDGLLWRETTSVGVGSGAASWMLKRPAPAGSTQIYVDDLFGGSSYGQQQVIDWKPIADAPAFSFANTLLRDYTSVPSFDVATSSVVWMEAATGAAPDVAVAEVSANRDGPPFLSWRWRLAGAPTGATLKYPTLPTEIAQFNPIAGDNVPVYDLTTAKVPGGYNAVRAVVLSIANPAALVAGPSGRIVVQRNGGRVTRTVPKATVSAPHAPARSR